MIEIEIDGKYVTIAWYRDATGTPHGRDYYYKLDKSIRAKFVAPMNQIANHPRYRNNEKFRYEGDRIFAVKIPKHRLMCFKDGRYLIITHGFPKKSGKLPPGQKDRAIRLRAEYFERKG